MEQTLNRFCPETALFHQLGVNLRIRLCGVKHYASAQMLDILDLAKNCNFQIRNLSVDLQSVRMATESELY